jgi:hypothetical protein
MKFIKECLTALMHDPDSVFVLRCLLWLEFNNALFIQGKLAKAKAT